jgi:Fic family protein
LINSQLPHNQLKPLNELRISKLSELHEVSESCWRAMYHLNGYVDAQVNNGVHNFFQLIELVDSKYSFDLEGLSISVQRLLEAYSSENNLNEKNARIIFKSIEWKDEIESLNVNNLAPEFMSHFKRQNEIFREKKEIRIQSYFTNLCLYTTPNNPSLIQYLKLDLDKALRQISQSSSLQSLALIHYQFRALAPYLQMNGHSARTLIKLFLREYGLLYSSVPISYILYNEKETYNSLLRDVMIHHSFEKWIAFIIQKIEESAILLLEKTKLYVQLRKKFKDQLEKYTDYILPSGELLEVLFYKPYVKPKMICEAIGCHRQTAYTYLDHLVKMGLLLEKSSGREKLYLNKEFADLLNL